MPIKEISSSSTRKKAACYGCAGPDSGCWMTEGQDPRVRDAHSVGGASPPAGTNNTFPFNPLSRLVAGNHVSSYRRRATASPGSAPRETCPGDSGTTHDQGIPWAKTAPHRTEQANRRGRTLETARQQGTFLERAFGARMPSPGAIGRKIGILPCYT